MLSGVNKNQREMSTGHYEKAHVYTKTLKKNKKTRQIRHHDRLSSNQCTGKIQTHSCQRSIHPICTKQT